MNFYKLLEELPSNSYTYINERVAVRGVIMMDNKTLLVHSNKSYYKFPGGGVEQNESHQEALIREIREETGYVNCIVKRNLGTVIERKIDEYDSNALFQMTSYYYLCELVDETKDIQELDDYEREEQFTPIMVSTEEAIRLNEIMINQLGQNSFLKRENYVLHQIEQCIQQEPSKT